MACASTTCVLLLLFVGGAKAFHLGHAVVKSHLSPPHSYHLIAPELFRNSSFAFATIKTPAYKSGKVGIDISVTITDKHSADDTKCSLSLRPDDVDSDIVVTSLKRLSDKQVVLVGYEALNDGKRKGLLIVLDLRSCETLYLYSSFDLPQDHVLVTRETSEKFEIFTNAPSAYPRCAHSKSRITFIPGEKESHCFDVNLSWSQIFVGAFSFSEDVVMVRGFDDTGAYKILVYNTAAYPNKQQHWLTLPRVTHKTQVLSSDLVVCWILDPDDDKTVHCSLIEKSGNLRLNKTITYEEPVRLLSVSHSEDASEIILLTGKARCDNADCESIFVSKVSDGPTNHRTIKLDCSAVDKKRLIIDARQVISKGAVAIEYVCENLNHFNLHSVILDDS